MSSRYAPTVVTMTSSPVPLLFGLDLLSGYLGETALVVAGAVLIGLRYRRWKMLAGAAVGAVSSSATVVVGVGAALVALVALGYWDPPVGQIISDALGAGSAAWELLGEPVTSAIVDWLEGVAE